jgi:cyanate permease
MTTFLALLGRLLIVDFPDKLHMARYPFLKPNEVQAIQDKLERDRRDAEYDEIDWPKFVRALARWELWVFALKFFAVTTIVYAFAFFLPIILQGMGYDVGRVFLLSAPPAVAAVPWVMFCSWAADRFKTRAPFVVLQALIGIVGFMIMAYAKNNEARYFGIFMGLAGANANIPTTLAWQANNIRGQSLRM